MKYTITINQFAAVTNGLDLDLIDLAIFDFIKDFAHTERCIKIQTPEGLYFWISHKLVLEAMPLLNIKTNQGLIKRIDNLIAAGILKKHPNCEQYSKTLYSFGKNYELLAFTDKAGDVTRVDTPQQKFMGGINKSLGQPINESLGDNIENNDYLITDNEVEPQTLFAPEPAPESENEKEKKTLFRNSSVYKLVKFDANGYGDYSEFESRFATPEFAPVDLVYYFHAVADWSDQKNMKRTANGWLATVRNFIRGDMEKNKLHLKQQHATPGINVANAVGFLTNDF